MKIPNDFQPHFRKSPLTEPWEPLFSRATKTQIIIGLLASEHHCNSRGFVHGGMLTALADNAMGLSCAQQHEQIIGLVTSTINVSFLAGCSKGQWIEFVTTDTKIGKRLDAAQGHILADGSICAHISATFSVVKAPKALAA
jgi:uncharacterized protein (TIGR00369 family)